MTLDSCNLFLYHFEILAGFARMKLKLITIQQSYLELVEERKYIVVINYKKLLPVLELFYTFIVVKLRKT